MTLAHDTAGAGRRAVRCDFHGFGGTPATWWPWRSPPAARTG
ncbi:hypothetical protein [Streptomyces megasporus]